MPCGGCRRNKKSIVSRRVKKRTTKDVISKISISADIVAGKKKKCSRCPFNTATGLSGRCKKTNRMIIKAVNDPSFKCPIKRF